MGARAQGDRVHGDREVDSSCARRRSLRPRSSRSRTSPQATTARGRSRSSSTAVQARPRRTCTWARSARSASTSRPTARFRRCPRSSCENESSWLAFTDLVFVDPVGTGFSRVIEPEKKGDGKEGAEASPTERDAPDPKEYFGYKRDLESMCEFMGRWLSEHGRWGSPVFIAGESYGGYRVGRLARMLQETAGIGLNGAILISPALEITPLNPTDYDVLGWIDRVPTMAAAAFHHGRSRAFRKGASLDKVLRDSEEFATGDYTAFLTRGASMPAKERARILARLADVVGLPEELVVRAEGRVGDPDLRPRAPARPAQDPRPLRLDDHGHRPVPRPRRVLVAGSDAVRDHARVHDGREPDAALGDRRRDGPRVHAPLLRGQHGLEERLRAPRVRGATRRDRRLPLRHGAQPAHEGVHHPRAVRPRDAVLRERPPPEPHAPRSADGGPAHRAALRRRAHVLRVGDEPARVHRRDRGVRRRTRSSRRARRRTRPPSRFGARRSQASSIRSSSCSREMRSSRIRTIGWPS